MRGELNYEHPRGFQACERVGGSKRSFQASVHSVNEEGARKAPRAENSKIRKPNNGEERAQGASTTVELTIQSKADSQVEPDLAPPKWAIQILETWVGGSIEYKDGFPTSKHYLITTCKSSEDADRKMQEIKEADRYAALMPKRQAERYKGRDHLVVHLGHPFYLRWSGEPQGEMLQFSWVIKGCKDTGQAVLAVAPGLYSKEGSNQILAMKKGADGMPLVGARAVRKLAQGVFSIMKTVQARAVTAGIKTTAQLSKICEDVGRTHDCSDCKLLGKHVISCLANNCSLPCGNASCVQRYYHTAVRLIEFTKQDKILRECFSRLGEFAEQLTTKQAQTLVQLSLSRLVGRIASGVKDRVVTAISGHGNQFLQPKAT